jgi:hypothetical protein
MNSLPQCRVLWRPALFNDPASTAVIRFDGGESSPPIVSRMSMYAMSTMSSIEDVFVNIAVARSKISLRVGSCGRLMLASTLAARCWVVVIFARSATTVDSSSAALTATARPSRWKAGGRLICPPPDTCPARSGVYFPDGTNTLVASHYEVLACVSCTLLGPPPLEELEGSKDSPFRLGAVLRLDRPLRRSGPWGAGPGAKR